MPYAGSVDGIQSTPGLQAVGFAALPYKAWAIYAGATGAPGGAIAQAITPLLATRTAYLTQAVISCPSPASQVAAAVTIWDGIWPLGPLPYWLVETTSAGGMLVLNFQLAPLIASAKNTAITVSVGAVAGGTAVDIALCGYEQG